MTHYRIKLYVDKGQRAGRLFLPLKQKQTCDQIVAFIDLNFDSSLGYERRTQLKDRSCREQTNMGVDNPGHSASVFSDLDHVPT